MELGKINIIEEPLSDFGFAKRRDSVAVEDKKPEIAPGPHAAEQQHIDMAED